jgi:hypothetical protein
VCAGGAGERAETGQAETKLHGISSVIGAHIVSAQEGVQKVRVALVSRRALV